ncbi:hypothetical protein FRB99_007917 [Tulasnella sp. 403]|nr:hypothetical protein FRB99_007917 [Tulasnella sp. 403]
MKSPPLLFALAAAFLCAQSSSASSIAPRPLVRIDHPLTESFHILPRQHTYDPRTRRRSIPSTEGRLLHTDSIRLSVRAFDETFHLHLKPNTDLIHPSARINYYDHDGRITHTEPLLASDYKIFHGDVVSDDRTYQRLREDFAGGLASPAPELGWARIIVHDEADGVQPIYEGVFTVRGQRYHIQTQTNYLRNRHPVDPSLVDPDHPLVIFRDSDILSDDDHSTARSCAHDKLRYNTDDALNPVLAYGTALRSSSRSPWYDPRLPSTSLTDPLALDARHVKRQNDMGGGNVTSNFIDRIGSHEGCKTTQSFIYMGVAADCTYVSHYGGTENATTQILNNWNSASSLYKSTFNVSMGIVELAVQQPT